MRTVLTAILLFLFVQFSAQSHTISPGSLKTSFDSEQNDIVFAKSAVDSSQSLSQPKGGGSPLTLEVKNIRDEGTRNSAPTTPSAEKSLADYFTIHPTPSFDKIYITGNDHYFSRIEVVNALGNILVFTNDKDSEILLSLPKLSKGTYDVKIYTDHGLVIKSFFKK